MGTGFKCVMGLVPDHPRNITLINIEGQFKESCHVIRKWYSDHLQSGLRQIYYQPKPAVGDQNGML